MAMRDQARASRLAEATFAGVWIAVAAALYWYAPTLISGWAMLLPGTTDVTTSPEFFPKLVAALMIVAGVGVILTGVRRTDVLPLFSDGVRRLLPAAGLLLACFAYAGAVWAVGYVIASVVFCVGISLWAGYRRVWLALLTATAVAVLLHVAFRYALKLELPTGILFAGAPGLFG